IRALSAAMAEHATRLLEARHDVRGERSQTRKPERLQPRWIEPAREHAIGFPHAPTRSAGFEAQHGEQVFLIEPCSFALDRASENFGFPLLAVQPRHNRDLAADGDLFI